MVNAITGMGIIFAIVSLNYRDNPLSHLVIVGLAIGLGGLGIVAEMNAWTGMDRGRNEGQ